MQDSSDSIVFENGSQASPDTDQVDPGGKFSEVDSDELKNVLSPLQREIQFMYIQMEFCERSTLR